MRLTGFHRSKFHSDIVRSHIQLNIKFNERVISELLYMLALSQSALYVNLPQYLYQYLKERS